MQAPQAEHSCCFLTYFTAHVNLKPNKAFCSEGILSSLDSCKEGELHMISKLNARQRTQHQESVYAI